MITILKATPRDVPTLLPLVADYWAFEAIAGFDPKHISLQLNRLLSEPKFGAGWMAIVEGNAVAYLLAVYVFSLEHLGMTAEIDELFVLPSQRGSGIGLDLLTAAEAVFTQARITNVSLQLKRDNAGARAFYHGRGYAERSKFEILDKTLVTSVATNNPR